jgi:hypothetical protein
METAAAGIARATPSRSSTRPATHVLGTGFMWTMSHAVSHLGTHAAPPPPSAAKAACLLVCRTAWDPLDASHACVSRHVHACALSSPPPFPGNASALECAATCDVTGSITQPHPVALLHAAPDVLQCARVSWWKRQIQTTAVRGPFACLSSREAVSCCLAGADSAGGSWCFSTASRDREACHSHTVTT